MILMSSNKGKNLKLTKDEKTRSRYLGKVKEWDHYICISFYHL